MYQPTTATKKINQLKKRIRAVQGGTSASKTISILLILQDLAQTDTEPSITSVVSESLPHLKKGAMRDFLSILEAHKNFDDRQWNKSDYTYTFKNGSQVEFFSGDQPGKVKGPRRKRLFINEANNIPYEVFDQLEVRTEELIFLDWNPSTEFWYYDKVQNRDDVDHTIVTYRDNEALSPNIIRSIEQRKGNPSWWRVYGEGQLGEIESRIYRGWRVVDEVPFEARLIAYGLDFGYTNDPTAIVAIYYYNGGYIIDEIAYQKQLSNKMIADILLAQPQKALVIADAAEPKSIDEIKLYGIDIAASIKGPGSVLQGIQFVQDQKISITKRSVAVKKEYNNYIWTTDKDGRIINVPDHLFSHSMDAIRYPMATLIQATQADDEEEEAERLLARLRNTKGPR